MKSINFKSKRIAGFYFYFPMYVDVFELNSVFVEINKVFDEADSVLKDDATSTVKNISIAANNWVIKRDNVRNSRIKLKRLLGPSRAFRSFVNALRLAELGILSVHPIAAVEERKACFFKSRSYFICDHIAGILAKNYFAFGAKPTAAWSEIAQQIVELPLILARHKLVHRDLNLSNLIIERDKLYLLDLDSMIKCCTVKSAKKQNKKQLQRFFKNLSELPQSEAAEKLFQPLIADTFDRF